MLLEIPKCVVSTVGQKEGRPHCTAKLLASFEMNLEIPKARSEFPDRDIPTCHTKSSKMFKCEEPCRSCDLWLVTSMRFAVLKSWDPLALKNQKLVKIKSASDHNGKSNPLCELDSNTTSTDQEHIRPPLRTSCRFPQKICSMNYCRKTHFWVQTIRWHIQKAFIDKICRKPWDNWIDSVNLERGFREGLEFLLS